MIEIKCLHLTLVKPRVARSHRYITLIEELGGVRGFTDGTRLNAPSDRGSQHRRSACRYT
jgi:hypothetical protein